MYPDPTPEMLATPQFEAVWQAIKGWDLKREDAAGYAGATGNDVRRILDALQALQLHGGGESRSDFASGSGDKVPDAAPCPNCGGEGWMCESHPWKLWNPSGCECGAGAPCMFCNRLSRASVLEQALDYLQSAMRETGWCDAEDFLPKARWFQQALSGGGEAKPKSEAPSNPTLQGPTREEVSDVLFGKLRGMMPDGLVRGMADDLTDSILALLNPTSPSDRP
jgi:hypothetical protein